MGRTTFTGPIKAGNILNTSGTTIDKDVKNVGFVSMAQAVPITQTTSTGQSAGVFKTDIVLPANSHIIGIQLAVTTAWTTGTTTVDIGTTAGGAELVSGGAAGTIGIIALSPGSDATRTAKWDDIVTGCRIWVKSNGGVGSGVGTIIVRYIQAQDTV
jgi:hypothetical protein